MGPGKKIHRDFKTFMLLCPFVSLCIFTFLPKDSNLQFCGDKRPRKQELPLPFMKPAIHLHCVGTKKEPGMSHNEQMKQSLDSTFIVNTLSALGTFFV